MIKIKFMLKNQVYDRRWTTFIPSTFTFLTLMLQLDVSPPLAVSHSTSLSMP